MKSVAVILATFQGERFLKEQLESISAQTHYPNELIITDDGSTDRTLDIAKEFSQKAPFPVRIIENPSQLGYGENFLRATEKVNSELIAFCDQDDVWDQSKLEHCVQAFDDERVVFCAHSALLIDQAGNQIGAFSQGIERSLVRPPFSFEPWGVFFGFSTVIKTSTLRAVPMERRGPDHVQPQRLTAHDRWAYMLGTTCGHTALLPQHLVRYRQHDANAFGRGGSSTLKLMKEPLAGVRDRAETYVAVAKHRSEMFLEASGQHAQEDVLARDLMRASEMWSEVAGSALKRLRVYQSSGRLGRIGAIVKNVLEGVYRTPPAGDFEPVGLAKDLLTVVKS